VFIVFALVAAGVIGGYALTQRKQGALVAGENANMVPGQPYGTVTVGAAPITNISQLGNGGGPASAIGTGASLAQTGTGLAAGLGIISKTGDLAKAVPIVGAVVGIGLTIYGIIAAHHKQALAAEGKALNDATPRAIQTLILILQAVINKEVTSASAAQSLVDQTIAAYYGEVKPIQRGRWPYVGSDLSLDYDKVWIKRTQVANPDAHAPDPCNGACVIGHFFVERNGKLVMAAVNDVLAGRHGSVLFPQVPAHETQQGYPAVTVTY